MVEIANQGSTSNNVSEDTKMGILRVDVLELRMSYEKIDGDDMKIAYVLKQMGKPGYEWFIELSKKPETWKEMKIILEERNFNIKERERRIKEQKSLEEIIAKGVEEGLKREMEKRKQSE